MVYVPNTWQRLEYILYNHQKISGIRWSETYTQLTLCNQYGGQNQQSTRRVPSPANIKFPFEGKIYGKPLESERIDDKNHDFLKKKIPVTNQLRASVFKCHLWAARIKPCPAGNLSESWSRTRMDALNEFVWCRFYSLFACLQLVGSHLRNWNHHLKP